MLETSGHKVDQPGLRGHSHDPENDLMKQVVVMVGLERMDGWLWLASFNTLVEAIHWVQDRDDWYVKDFRIIDQFNNNEIVWEG